MSLILSDFAHNYPILAQTISDVDILADINEAWNNFVETGQVWAFLIGIFFGYVFASFTRF